MTYDEVEHIVHEHVMLIKVDGYSLANGRDLCAKFLVVESVLSTYLKTLENAKAQITTLENATYAQAIMTGNGKNVTENKISAAVDPQYAHSRESKEKLEAEVYWVKTHMKIFENAHLMFRQFSKEQ